MKRRREQTGGVRLRTLLESGKRIGGYWIDTYNQSVNADVAGTVTTRIDAGCCWYVSVYEES